MRSGLVTSFTDGPMGPESAKAPAGIPGLDLGLEFLAAGARKKYREPGVLLTFEEPAGKVAASVVPLGFGLGALQRDGGEFELRAAGARDGYPDGQK